jgi:mono/diheme cytochrome c family protein
MKHRDLPPWITWASLLTCLLGWSACGAGEEAAAQDPAASAAQKVQTPAELYQAHCALCHGVDGDGEGLVQLDRPARSFKKGAFSFGNTPEALFRTISNGIGGTPMPGFKEGLTVEQREQLADYVIELGPEQEPVIPGASELHVTDFAQVVRGTLPPIADGLAPVTRGLLVGGVDGLTFQYNAKPVVLLGVRQGGFVDRKDWQGRGGAELQPLGVVSSLVDGGHGTHMWLGQAEDSSWRPLVARLIATEVRQDGAWIEYSLLPENAKPTDVPIVLRENGQAITRAGWPGYRRTFVTSNDSAVQLSLLQEDKVTQIAKGGRGRLLLLKTPEDPATYVLESRITFRSFGGNGGAEHRSFIDVLYGLQPTEENLAGLKELVQ